MKWVGLVDYFKVKGCMVIKFIGFVIWENMRDEFDWMFKEIGYVNVYFLLFIFKSFFSCEV